MQVSRPALLSLELRERTQSSLARLLSAADGAAFEMGWIALAAHLGREVELEREDLPLLEALPPGSSVSREELAARFGIARVDRLLDAGLLLGDHDGHAALRAQDARLAAGNWWPPAALAQRFGRWSEVDVADAESREGPMTVQRLVQMQGLPPPETPSLRDPASWLSLPVPRRTELDELLSRRTTCRNFDAGYVLPAADLALVLHRVFGAQARLELTPGASMLKKNSASGGGLHPIEAYLLVQRAQGLAPGVYHYQCLAHALEPMRELAPEQAQALAHELVAGQPWFANAPVLVLMAARFERTFWKYPRHAKAWKVVQLDAGHLSQNLYLSATELGHGAFITAAINDECAERVFELDGVSAGAVAVCGFGKRSAQAPNLEFDPLGRAVR